MVFDFFKHSFPAPYGGNSWFHNCKTGDLVLPKGLNPTNTWTKKYSEEFYVKICNDIKSQ